MVLSKLLFKPIKLSLKPLFFVFFKIPLKAFFNFSTYFVLIFLFYVVFKFISLTAFILARNIWPSITSGSIFADPDKLPTSTGLYAASNPKPTSPSDPNPLPPSDDNAAPPVDQDPVPPSDANPAPAPPPAPDTDVPPISSPTAYSAIYNERPHPPDAHIALLHARRGRRLALRQRGNLDRVRGTVRPQVGRQRHVRAAPLL